MPRTNRTCYARQNAKQYFTMQLILLIAKIVFYPYEQTDWMLARFML